MENTTKKPAPVPVELSKKGLIADVMAGMKREDMAKKYGLSRGAITKAMKAAGLNKTRAASVPFRIIDDVETAAAAPAVASEEAQA